MSAPRLGDDDALELVELLGFVADVCRVEHDIMSAALARFVGVGYDARRLAHDATRLARVVAATIGLEPSMEPVR